MTSCTGVKRDRCTSPCKWASGKKRSFCRQQRNSKKKSAGKSQKSPSQKKELLFKKWRRVQAAAGSFGIPFRNDLTRDSRHLPLAIKQLETKINKALGYL